MDLYILRVIYWIILLIQIFFNPVNTDQCHQIRNKAETVDLPKIHILKRKIQNSRASEYMTIAIAYQSENPVRVRWYRQAANDKLHNSDILNMLPVSGDKLYYNYQLSSNDVHTSNLVAKKLLGMVPPSYTAVFLLNNSLQYQVHTHIPPAQVFSRERLYLPDSIQMYVHKTKKGQPAFVQCVANVHRKDPNQSYKIEMVHQRLVKKKPNSKKYKVFSRQLGKITQQSGKIYKNLGNNVNIEKSKNGFGLEYKIDVCLPHLTTRDLGHYKCELKSSTAVLNVYYILNDGDTIISKPVVQFLPCDISSLQKRKGHAWNKRDVHLVLSSSEETCLRCRAAGPPNMKVAIRAIKQRPGHRDRPGADLDTYPNVTKVMYTDITDIRDRAVTYILHHPSKQHAGMFLCYAEYKHNNKDYFSSQKLVIKFIYSKP